MTTLLIPGLLCDGVVWAPVLRRLPKAQVADLSTQSSITRMAEDLLAAQDGPLRVAGHSMGARVAMEMARLAPERVDPGDLVSIPAGAVQWIENTGDEDLVFYAICTPRFRMEAYRDRGTG